MPNAIFISTGAFCKKPRDRAQSKATSASSSPLCRSSRAKPDLDGLAINAKQSHLEVAAS